MARYSIVKRHKDYYRYGTEPNVTVVGNFAKIDKGVASGFSASQYLTYPVAFTPSTQTWEKVFKYTTGSTVTDGTVYSNGTVDKCGDSLFIYGSKPRFLIGYTASAWNVDSTANYTLSPNTSYWFKIAFTSTSYTVDVSTNGTDYENIISVTSSTVITANMSQLNIGQRLGYSSPLTSGSIDLNQSYIKINDELWWSGDSYTKVGSWIDDGVVSGFTTANYLRVPTAFNHEGNSWEIVCKLTTGSNVTANNQYMTTNSNQGVSLVVEASRFKVSLSSNGSSFDIASNAESIYAVLPNTEYWVKVLFDGEAYKFSYSLDGEVYNPDIEVISSKKIYDNGVLNIGIGRLISQPWLGSIDLTQSYIKINGERWWHGTKAVEVPTADITDFGSTKYFKNVVTTRYWKEITTDSKELEYACYKSTGLGVNMYYYVKTPIGSDYTIYCNSANSGASIPSSSSQLTTGGGKYLTLNEEQATFKIEGVTYVDYRYTAGDLYKDTTITAVVEGTPEDYTYTTEEIVPVEVTADDEYDYKEFVPSAEFDYYVDKNKLYNLTRRTRTYYKNWTQPVNPTGITTSGWTNATQAFDGVSSTYAYTSSNSAYIEYDFGQEVYVTGFDAVGWWVDSVAHYSALDIYSVDEDGVETLIKAGERGSASANYPTWVEFPAVKTSKVRFKTHDTLGYQVRIREITVNGYADGTKDDYDYYTDRNVPYNIMLKH